MAMFKIGDWVIRKPAFRHGHPFWRLHQDTPMQIVAIFSNGDILFKDIFKSWMEEFFDLSEPLPPVSLEDWL